MSQPATGSPSFSHLQQKSKHQGKSWKHVNMLEARDYITGYQRLTRIPVTNNVPPPPHTFFCVVVCKADNVWLLHEFGVLLVMR